MTVRDAPKAGAPPRLPRLPIQTHTFDNGLTLAVVERRGLPIVDLDLVIRAGAAFDQPSLAGRALMTAEMIDEGTPSRSAMQIADEIDYLGGDLHISAGFDSTVLSLHILTERLEPALDVFADVAVQAEFPSSEFERKKRERLTGLLQDRDEARIVANKALALGIFGAQHPYGVPAGGTYESMGALSLQQVHEFYRQHFGPANAFVVAVGDVVFADLVGRLGQRFEAWRGPAAANAVLEPTSLSPATRTLLVSKPGAAQAEIRVGHIGPARDTSDYFPLVVMNTILGGAFTSRLNLRLREEMGVTYGASSKFGWRRNGGVFWASSAVDREAAAESVNVMLQEMRRMQDSQLDPNEVRRAVQYLAYGLPRAFETTDDIAAHLREQFLYGLELDYWAAYVDRVLAVTPQQVTEVARRYLHPDRAVTVVVADRVDVEEKLHALGIGEVLITEVPT
jgi:zinc protease